MYLNLIFYPFYLFHLFYLLQKYAKNFSGFEELFGRFVEDKGHGLVWEDISPPPEAMVSGMDLV